jgi:hypothetical protein
MRPEAEASEELRKDPRQVLSGRKLEGRPAVELEAPAVVTPYGRLEARLPEMNPGDGAELERTASGNRASGRGGFRPAFRHARGDLGFHGFLA